MAPAPELDDLGLGEEGLGFFISVKSFLMVWYCKEVAEARRELALVSWGRVVPLLVAALAVRSRWPSRACSARSLAWVDVGYWCGGSDVDVAGSIICYCSV